MKKFKLAALALLASAFGLASCDLPEFVQVPLDWANEKIVDPIKDLIPGGKKDEQEDEGEDEGEKEKAEVVSVKVLGLPEDIDDETAPFQLSAEVEVKGDASKDVTWSSSDTSVATVDANGKVTLTGAEGKVTISAASVADPSKVGSVEFEVYINPAVLSVKIEGAPEEAVMYAGSVELSANVATKGQIAKGVTWSSSDESVATVDENGAVTLVGEGSVTITATSKIDASKSDSVTFSVVYKGLHPELLEEGYAFSQSFPSEAAAAFAGTEVLGFEAQEGFYYMYHEAHDTYVAYLEIYTELTQANINALYAAYEDAGYFYSEDYGNVFIDPSISYELDASSKNLSSDGSDYVLSLCIYNLDELWVLETTTDTEWNESVSSLLESNGFELPFVALGDGYKAEEEEGAIYIYDSCANYHLLDDYEEKLEGFEKITSDDGEYFAKQINEFTIEFVSFGFTEYGNMIMVSKEPVELEEYPGAAVDKFIAEVIESENTLPAFTGEGFIYTYEDLSVEEGPAIGLGFKGASEEQCISYVNDLVENYGFKVDDASAIEHQSGISATFLQKGKICLVAEIIYGLREATEEENEALYEELMDLYIYFYYGMEYLLTEEEVARFYELYDLIYDFDNMLFMTYDYENAIAGYLIVYGDPDGIEGEGLFFEETSGKFDEGEEFELTPIFNKIEEATVTYSSSDESIATVDANGVVSCLAEGTAIIQGSIEGTEYSAEFALTVRKVLPIMENIPDAIAFYAGYDVELVLPNVSGATAFDEGVYNGTPYVEITVDDPVDEAMYNYALKLLGEDFEVSYDDYNEAYIAIKDEVKIVFYEYSGVLNIDFYYLAPAIEADSFPYEIANAFLSDNGMDFAFTEEQANALPGESFSYVEGEEQGYPALTITIGGSYVEQYAEFFSENLGSGFSSASVTWADYAWKNSNYQYIAIWEDQGVTTVFIWG